MMMEVLCVVKVQKEFLVVSAWALAPPNCNSSGIIEGGCVICEGYD